MENQFNKFARSSFNVSGLTLHKYRNHVDTFIPQSMTPNVIEERQMNAIALSVFDRLMADRIIFLGTPINDVVANIVNAQLLFLESLDSRKDISIYINSPGGSVYDGLGIYDLMQYVSPDISTVNTGIAASMAAVLLCAGSHGKRFALKHSRTMIHQPSSRMEGTVSDMEISLKEGLKSKKELYEIISLHSGVDVKKVEKDGDRDFWMTSDEARKYGIIDEILTGRK